MFLVVHIVYLYYVGKNAIAICNSKWYTTSIGVKGVDETIPKLIQVPCEVRSAHDRVTYRSGSYQGVWLYCGHFQLHKQSQPLNQFGNHLIQLTNTNNVECHFKFHNLS
jgi:hypothetical protein